MNPDEPAVAMSPPMTAPAGERDSGHTGAQGVLSTQQYLA